MSERDTATLVVDMHSGGKNKLEIAQELSLQGWVFYDALEFTESVYESESLKDPIRMGSSLDDMRKQPPIDF
ncbi:hypothetical protein LRP49_04960 [Enterovibrio sp. ZSDZ35]|uniref:Uncharacterized protein n=1 Tax=Enterovibrio qingdaonensis TaxID=2899818 RepID=A0ABT5QHT1_9GAMM|nr:hypothetical protein [Enterovibrio sp. ZSDZ35]MDD1780546.1 hypothetical protein [Enterovibrio sp. ZSDZ35]